MLHSICIVILFFPFFFPRQLTDILIDAFTLKYLASSVVWKPLRQAGMPLSMLSFCTDQFHLANAARTPRCSQSQCKATSAPFLVTPCKWLFSATNSKPRCTFQNSQNYHFFFLIAHWECSDVLEWKVAWTGCRQRAVHSSWPPELAATARHDG